MKKKTVSLTEALEMFADYVSMSDLIATRLLSKISASIVKKRLDMGLNQTEFAKKMSVSQAMVSKWESENYNYSIEGLADICAKLDLDIDISIKDKTLEEEYSNTPVQKWNIHSKKEKGIEESRNLTLLSMAS